jgi:hypothetical protein
MSEVQLIEDEIQCTIPQKELTALSRTKLPCEGNLCGGIEFDPDEKGCCPLLALCAQCYKGISNELNGMSIIFYGICS